MTRRTIKMRPEIQARRNAYAVPVTVAALITVLLVAAAAGVGPQVNSGQPRELINQEDCWTPENYDDISRCELED